MKASETITAFAIAAGYSNSKAVSAAYTINLKTVRGPVIPAGESCVTIEATKGLNAYYLTSDGGTMSYRTRIRTPSFPHLQMIPMMCRGMMVADLIAILASIDFVMADVDR